MRQLVELQNDYQAIKDLQAEVLAVSVDDLRRAGYVVDRLGLEFPIMYNTEADMVKEYGVFNLLNDGLATPSTFVIDTQGKVRWKYIGVNIADRPSTRSIIRQLKKLQED